MLLFGTSTPCAKAQQASLDKLDAFQQMVRIVDLTESLSMKPAALERIGRRDPDDWPVLAD